MSGSWWTPFALLNNDLRYMNFIADYKLWILALHIIAFVSWMAGLFYLPRLYVYHCQVSQGSQAAGILMTMERRLYRFIMMPAMIATMFLVFYYW